MYLRSKRTLLKDLPDADLLVMVNNDVMEAFEELYNRHWQKLYSFAFKRVRSRESAEEIVQEFLTNLWANRKSIYIATSFEGYIYTAIRNLIFNYFAKEARYNNYQQFVQLFNQGIDNSTEETVYINDLNHNLQKELGFLPSKCRSVFELSRKENKTNKEIALELGISEKTVESHLTKAIKRLRLGLNALMVLAVFFCGI
jgi:RNA polymerase sigma-70 factor (ECF subfamily)